MLTDRSLPYWIGFSDINNEGNFTWTDGSAVDYTDWWLDNPSGSKEPNGGRNENCGHYFQAARVEASQKWNDASCDIQMKYVCKIPGNVFR